MSKIFTTDLGLLYYRNKLYVSVKSIEREGSDNASFVLEAVRSAARDAIKKVFGEVKNP